MPLKDDFLTRAVEQMAKTVVTVTTLKERAQFDEALSEVNRAYRANTGSGREIIHLLPSEQLIDLLGSSGVVDAEKCLLIAELLRVEADVLEARDGEAPPALPLKSLDLLLEALLAEDTLLPDYAARVESLEKNLGRLQPALRYGTPFVRVLRPTRSLRRGRGLAFQAAGGLRFRPRTARAGPPLLRRTPRPV